MSESIARLNMEHKILKQSIKLTKKNLQEDSLKQSFDLNIAKLFSILDCSIDQTNKLFKLASDDGEIRIMKSFIKDNFKRERLLIQNLAIKIYRVTRSMALQIVYDLCRSSIDEELKFLHYDFEDLVKNCDVGELVNDPNYHRVLELFSDHQKDQSAHDELFVEAQANNNVDGMNQSIASDIPQELKIVNKIRETIYMLQLK